MNFEELSFIIESLELPAEVNEKIYAVLKPERYVGLATELTRQAVAFYDKFKMNAAGEYLRVKN